MAQIIAFCQQQYSASTPKAMGAGAVGAKAWRTVNTMRRQLVGASNVTSLSAMIC